MYNVSYRLHLIMVYLKVLCENFQDDHLVVLATLVLSWVELIFQTVKISHCPFQIVVDDTTKVIPYHLHNKLDLFLFQNEIYENGILNAIYFLSYKRTLNVMLKISFNSNTFMTS